MFWFNLIISPLINRLLLGNEKNHFINWIYKLNVSLFLDIYPLKFRLSKSPCSCYFRTCKNLMKLSLKIINQFKEQNISYFSREKYVKSFIICEQILWIKETKISFLILYEKLMFWSQLCYWLNRSELCLNSVHSEYGEWYKSTGSRAQLTIDSTLKAFTINNFIFFVGKLFFYYYCNTFIVNLLKS